MSADRGAARPAALGKGAKSVFGPEQADRDLGKWALKRAAAGLLRTFDAKAGKRVSQCGYTAHAAEVSLVINRATGAAHFTGLTTCANVWCCPVCAPRIAAKRKDELDRLLAGARGAGLSVFLVTLTFQHDRRLPLVQGLTGLKEALRRLRQSKDWRDAAVAGSVTATEVTHGENGWHPHNHVLCIMEGSPAEGMARLSALAEKWRRCLRLEGLDGNGHAFQVQDASAAGAYVAKFGAAEEVALGAAKRGRAGSRTPWQLLDDARDGDARAAAVWIEYARTFKGRRQLVWSRGLKARFLIDEVSDLEASEEGDPAASEPETLTILRTWHADGLWTEARRRRCALIAAARAGGDLWAAESGPTDAERWRELRYRGEVIDHG